MALGMYGRAIKEPFCSSAPCPRRSINPVFSCFKQDRHSRPIRCIPPPTTNPRFNSNSRIWRLKSSSNGAVIDVSASPVDDPQSQDPPGEISGGIPPKNELLTTILTVGLTCSLAVLAMFVFIRNVENVAGNRMFNAALIAVGIEAFGPILGVFRNRGWEFYIGVVSRIALVAFCVIAPLPLYTEEYFYDFSVVNMGASIGLATITILLSRLVQVLIPITEKTGSWSNLNSRRYLMTLDVENIQSMAILKATVVLVFLGALVFLPLFKEVLFRGVLMTSFSRINQKLAVLVTCAVFSLVQSAKVTDYLDFFVQGLVLTGGYMFFGGNLLVPLFAHCLHNTVMFTMRYKELMAFMFRTKNQQ